MTGIPSVALHTSEGLALGEADRALLDRLRAIALLLRAARATAPGLGNLHIGLWISDQGRLRLIQADAIDVVELLADAGGWPDSPSRGESLDDLLRTCNTAFARVDAAELPAVCPRGLAGLLEAMRQNAVVPPALISALTQAGWTPYHWGGYIYPTLPENVSAHEALDALAGAEANGGLGHGPLGVLAHRAAAALSGSLP